MPFKTIGLLDPLVRGILATGYDAPTEIQAQAIPAAIEGKDLIGCAQTGTGKTAAFVLPILNKFCEEQKGKKKKAKIKALILSPTRELAVQIERAIADYSRYLKLRTLAVYGGVSMNKQLATLRRGVDIVVSTPGRLMDHMQRRTINLSGVETLVIDEADRMFDMGFINDVKKIVSALPEKRQTLLFSATMPPEVQALTEGIQTNPVKIQIGKEHNPIDTITQYIYPVDRDMKMDLLLYLLETEAIFSALVFSRTKHGADKISRRLEKNGFTSASLHSGHTQRQRQRVMDNFKRGKFQVMVATDIAARGIDVDGISHVFNFDIPTFAEDYVHRIGRTGRAAATGDAISFVSRDEVKYLRKIESFIDRKFKMEHLEGFTITLPSGKGKKSSRKKSSGRPARGKGNNTSRPAGKKTTGKKKAANYKSGSKNSKSGSGKPTAKKPFRRGKPKKKVVTQ